MDKASYLIENIRILEDEISKKEEIIGIFIIKLVSWDIKENSPFLILTKQNIYIVIGKNFSHKSIDNLETLDHEKGIIKLKIKNDEDLKFGLVKIDSEFKTIDENYSKLFFEFLKTFKEKEIVNKELLAELPNQFTRAVSQTNSISFVIFSITLLTLSFMLQNFSVVISWFLFIVGIFTMIIGLVRIVLGKN